MCTRVTCEHCGKPSYAGCGLHVEQVLRDVPVDARCKCRESRQEHAGDRPWWKIW